MEETMETKFLIQAILRLMEVSGKSVAKNNIVDDSDPTSITSIIAYAYIPEGAFSDSTEICDHSLTCNRQMFGSYAPEINDVCRHCLLYNHNKAMDCLAFEQNCGQLHIPSPPRVIQIRIVACWGYDISIYDCADNSEIMSCYWDKEFTPRESYLEPEKTLMAIFQHAEFLSSKQVVNIMAELSDGESVVDAYYKAMAQY
jgi:hypothetical protein